MCLWGSCGEQWASARAHLAGPRAPVSAAGSSPSRAKTWVWLLPTLQQPLVLGRMEQSSRHSNSFFPRGQGEKERNGLFPGLWP